MRLFAGTSATLGCGMNRLVWLAVRSVRSAPANIVQVPGEAVFGVLYQLPLRKFARLDNSEGRQYRYVWTDVEDNEGRRVRAVTYQVAVAAAEGRPSQSYLNLIQEAARQRGFPADYIARLDRVEVRT